MFILLGFYECFKYFRFLRIRLSSFQQSLVFCLRADAHFTRHLQVLYDVHFTRHLRVLLAFTSTLNTFVFFFSNTTYFLFFTIPVSFLYDFCLRIRLFQFSVFYEYDILFFLQSRFLFFTNTTFPVSGKVLFSACGTRLRGRFRFRVLE